jgi:tetratricopeptide (TPR) repeat protein
LRQITADPVALLGRESFPYTVRANETLSRIAGRFLGDIYSFYILARYNDIKIPRQVSGGQVIRIPGKAPPPGALDAEPRRTDKPASGAPTPTAAPTPPAAPAVAEPSTWEKALTSADAAEKRGDLERAYNDYRTATGGELSTEALAKSESLRRRLVQRYTVNARSAFAKQDLDGAIRHWDRVLQLDPSNDTARLEQQKARALKEKIKSLK